MNDVIGGWDLWSQSRARYDKGGITTGPFYECFPSDLSCSVQSFNPACYAPGKYGISLHMFHQYQNQNRAVRVKLMFSQESIVLILQPSVQINHGMYTITRGTLTMYQILRTTPRLAVRAIYVPLHDLL